MSGDAAQPLSGVISDGVHVLPVRVYYEDTDTSGIVYHANYLRYIERARTEILRLGGVGHQELMEGEDPIAFAVRRMTIDFLKPARIDEALQVRTVFNRMTGARLVAEQSVWRGGDELFRAEVEVACLDPKGRARRIPAGARAALAPFIKPGG